MPSIRVRTRDYREYPAPPFDRRLLERFAEFSLTENYDCRFLRLSSGSKYLCN